MSQTTKNSPVPGPLEGPFRVTPKSLETRSRIIDGAIRTLEEHGLGDVTTRRIAAAAGVRLATLHYHFDSKETLLLAVLEALNAEMIDKALGTVSRAGGLEARLEGIIRACWQHATRTREKQIAQIELTLYALRTRGSEWLAARQYDAYVAVYSDMLTTGNEGDEPPCGAVAETLARFVLCGMDGLILQSFSLRDEAAANAGLEALVVASRDYLRRLTRGG